MKRTVLEEYLNYLSSKGFRLNEGDRCFIDFGRYYVNAEDEQVKIAIEITLNHQFAFDGSYYISILESLTKEKINNKREAYAFLNRLVEDDAPIHA